jgi:hypothetical protein
LLTTSALTSIKANRVSPALFVFAPSVISAVLGPAEGNVQADTATAIRTTTTLNTNEKSPLGSVISSLKAR